MTALTLNQVLEFWLLSIVGAPKRVRPKGYTTTTPRDTAALVAICRERVESLDGLEQVRPILQEYVTLNGIDDEAFIAIADVLGALEESLSESPIIPAPPVDEASKRESEPLTCSQFANVVGVPVSTVRMWCDTGRVDCYKFGKKWMIYERELHRVKELKNSRNLLVS